jgi:pSer/pThr/pTyr-binding forkhead associated (FHA) protein
VDVNLVVFRPDGTRREARLEPGTYLIGRDQDATLRIPMKSVSREHCELVIDASGASVRDLGSTNGTFVNGARTQKANLTAGDVLTVGGVHMVLQIDGKPATVERPRADLDLDLNLDDTPPGALSTARSKPAKPARSDDASDGSGEMTRGTADDDLEGSSAFEFDFDFPDDDEDGR